MAKLSVLMCVYNTRPDLLDGALDSIYKSCLKDFEVVLIDDGSTEDYSELLDKYKTIKYFKTKNQGTLAARLLAISKASAPYVCFVDSDDMISPQYFLGSISQIEKTGADIVINDWAFHTDRARYSCLNDSTIGGDIVLEGDEVLGRFIGQKGREHSYYVLWNKVFKKEILNYTKEKVQALKVGKLQYAEDVLLSYFAFAKARRVENLHLGYYFYRIHSGQEIKVEDREKLLKHIKSMNKVFGIMEKDLKASKRFAEVNEDFLEWKRLLCSTHYMTAKNSGFKDLLQEVLDAYGFGDLKKMEDIKNDVYGKQKLLPDNLSDVDAVLKEIMCVYDGSCVYVPRRNAYSRRQIDNYCKITGNKICFIDKKTNKCIALPKEKIAFKKKIIHNAFVYKIGLKLFPKGSKLRNILKAKL